MFPRANATAVSDEYVKNIFITLCQVGDPLFLTPYIESGDIETARSLASVDWNLLQVRVAL